MRPGRVRPRRDDALERDTIGAFLVEELLDRPRDVELRPADEALLRKALEHAVRDLAGPPDRNELVLVLDGTQALDEAAARDGLDRSRPERLPPGVRHVVRLEADPTGQPLGEIPEQRALRFLEPDTIDRAGGFRVAKVGEQPHAVVVHEQSRVRALEPEQVVDVRGVRDQQGLLERSAQPLDSRGHDFRVPCATRNASASRYPSGPFPITRSAARSASTECFRQSSRSSMFERCTSTIGASSSSSASRIA